MDITGQTSYTYRITTSPTEPPHWPQGNPDSHLSASLASFTCKKMGVLVEGMMTISSWWLNQPIWNICGSQIGSWNPKVQVENKTIFELPPPRLFCWRWCFVFCWFLWWFLMGVLTVFGGVFSTYQKVDPRKLYVYNISREEANKNNMQEKGWIITCQPLDKVWDILAGE